MRRAPVSKLLCLPALALVGATLVSCTRLRSTPWQDHMGGWFDNASVRPPEPTIGRWTRRDWDLFLKRIGHADLAAVGRIEVVSTFHQLNTPRQVRLIFVPTAVLHGSLDGLSDGEGTVTLALYGGGLDFQVALRAQQGVPGRPYLLFAKTRPKSTRERPPPGWEGSLWRRPPAAAKRFRWALYRPEPALLSRVRTMYRWFEHR